VYLLANSDRTVPDLDPATIVAEQQIKGAD
jgi:hypothetical protein